MNRRLPLPTLFCQRPTWPTLVTVAVLAWFAAAILLSARWTPLVFDAALHGIMARNVASGYGWAMSYPGRELFLTISSGPTLIMPAALLTALLGNRIWVPALSAGLLHTALLCILLWRLRKLCHRPWQLPAAALGLAALFLYFETMWWTLLIGEISAWLLFLIACTVAVDPTVGSERRRYLYLGLLASLSLLARMISLPAFAGLALYLLWREGHRLYQDRQYVREITLRIAAGLTGMALVALPFNIYHQLHFLGADTPSYIDYLRYRLDFYHNLPGVGTSSLFQQADPIAALIKKVQYNYQQMADVLGSYGIGTASLLCLLASIVLLRLWSVWRPQQPLDALIDTLACATVLYALWYFVFQTSAFNRYALLPLLTLFCLLCLQIARHATLPGIILLLGCLLLIAPPQQLLLSRQTLLFQPISWLDGRIPEHSKELLQVRDYLRDTPLPYPLANCGWMGSTRELEYLLPQPENFLNCFDAIEAALEPDPMSADGAYRWREPVAFTLVINEIAWRMAKSHKPSAIRHRILAQACTPATLYRSPLYRIMLCHAEALHAHVPLDRDTPFIGQREPLEQRPLVDARQRLLSAAGAAPSAAGTGHGNASP